MSKSPGLLLFLAVIVVLAAERLIDGTMPRVANALHVGVEWVLMLLLLVSSLLAIFQKLGPTSWRSKLQRAGQRFWGFK